MDFIIDSSEKWQQPRASVADIYQLIVSDLEEAQKRLWKKSEYADEDLGRATKGAAQAMLLKVNLYMASDGLRTEIGGNAADYDRQLDKAFSFMNKYGYPAVILVSAAIVAALLAYFKKKKWL